MAVQLSVMSGLMLCFSLALSAPLDAPLKILVSPAHVYSHWLPLVNTGRELAARGHVVRVICTRLRVSAHGLQSTNKGLKELSQTALPEVMNRHDIDAAVSARVGPG